MTSVLSCKDEEILQKPRIDLAIVGSRNFTNEALFNERLQLWIDEHGVPDSIISGGAQGADLLAERYAQTNRIAITVFKADWKQHGKRAGPIRNAEIVRCCTHVLAFPSHDGKGTQDTIQKAEDAGIKVTEYYVD